MGHERKAATPSEEEVGRMLEGGQFRRVPIKRELFSDWITPITAMRRLRAVSNHCFMLESAEADESWGRYTFLGFSPSLELTCADGLLTIKTTAPNGEATVEQRQVEHPREAIREVLAAHKSAQLPGFPPFTGGMVGYFAYDYIKYAEPTLRRERMGNEDFLDVDLMLFDSVVCFDNYKQKIELVSGVELAESADAEATSANRDAQVSAAYAAAIERLDAMERVLRDGAEFPFEPLALEGPMTSAFDRERYRQMIETTRDHIREGDIFQAVISNPQTAPATGSLFDTYRILRCQNPSPYMFYFTSSDVEIAGASPETLVRLTDGHLMTFPIAGTRPRGATPEEDARLEAELLADEKELSEHNMLVDLGRNDLGRIARIGTVEVTKYQEILRFSRVMHIASTVEAEIAPGRDALDAVDSVLPAGTLSGAPKLRACQIIGELEGAKRGIYGGAIGYLDLSGNMDLCISIRLAYKKNGVVCVQSGGGIVADSDAEFENQERLNKARAVVEALETAQGGIA